MQPNRYNAIMIYVDLIAAIRAAPNLEDWSNFNETTIGLRLDCFSIFEHAGIVARVAWIPGSQITVRRRTLVRQSRQKDRLHSEEVAP